MLRKLAQLEWLVFVVLSLAWLVYQMIVIGNTWDEWEHVHTAWLMAVKHKKPLVDFFQHHYPLLWDLLGLYFSPNRAPTGVFFYGRILISVALLSSVILGECIARRLAGLRDFRPPLLTLSFLAISSVVSPWLWVIRPESLATAFVGLAFLLAIPPKSYDPKRIVAAGISFGYTCLISPRFAALAGFFWIVRGESKFRDLVRDFALLGLGVLLSYFLFWRMPGHTWEYLRFATLWSKTVIGFGKFWVSTLSYRQYIEAFIVSALFLSAFFIRSRGVSQKTWILLNAYPFVLMCFILYSSFVVPHHHNLVPWIFWLFFLIPLWEKRFLAIRWRKTALATGCIAALVVIGATFQNLRTQSTLAGFIQWREAVLKCLKPEDRVLVQMPQHPAFVEDASYHDIFLTWSTHEFEKGCDLANNAFKGVLPPCNHVAELVRGEPALIDSDVYLYIQKHSSPVDWAVIEKRYLPAGGPFYLRADRMPCKIW